MTNSRLREISQESLRASREEYLMDVYPVVGKAGNFICFFQWLDYVSFVALTKRLPGEYLEENYPELIAEPLDVENIQWVLQEDAESDGCPKDLSKRMTYVSQKLRENMDYVNKMKEDYSKDFFPDRWPQ